MTRIQIAWMSCLALAGCDRVFLDDRPISRIDVSLVRERGFITDQVEIVRLEATGVRASVLVRDDDEPSGFREIAMRADADDVFHATVPDGERLVRFQSAGEPLQVYALDAPDLVVRDSVYGHADPAPAPPNAQLELAVELDRPYAREPLEIVTIGAWARRPLTVPEQPALGETTWRAPPISFSSLTTLPGGPAQALRTDDRVLILRHDSSGMLDGMLSVPGYEQSDGVDRITASMVTLTATSHLFEIDPQTTAARLNVVRPNPVLTWSVNAAPGAAVSRANGPVLAGQTVPEISSHVIATYYPEPFAGWPSVVRWSGTALRGTTGPVAIPILATLYQAAELPPDPPPGPPMVMSQPQGLPLLVSLEGTPLVADGAAITFDHDHEVTLEMTIDRAPPACDKHGFTLVSIDPATTLRTTRFSVFSTTPSVTVPGALFSPDVVYLIQATCEVGAREIGEGRTALTLPYGVGTLDTAVFFTP